MSVLLILKSLGGKNSTQLWNFFFFFWVLRRQLSSRNETRVDGAVLDLQRKNVPPQGWQGGKKQISHDGSAIVGTYFATA